MLEDKHNSLIDYHHQSNTNSLSYTRRQNQNIIGFNNLQRTVEAMYLTTEAVIADKPGKNAPAMPDMGGISN